MQIPAKIPGLRLVSILTAAFAAAWITLEGNLWRVLIMGTSIAIVTIGHVTQRYAGGRTVALGRWLQITAAIGLLLGLGSAVFSLLFMAIKTGLHAHGPEFTIDEIRWLVGQVPLWSLVGLLAGLGIGMLTGRASER